MVEQEKTEKEKKTRLFWLILLAFLTFILLSTSTYAWFTANKIVSVDTLNVKVESQGGIEISVDGTNWKSIVNQEDIKNASSTYGTSINQMPETLKPVSTGGSVASGFLNMYYGVTNNNDLGEYILTSTKSTEALGNTGEFVAFDVFFKVDKAAQAYLTPQSKVSYVGEQNPGVENAVRIAFLDEGTVPVGSSLGSIQSLRGGTSENLYIWEPNSNTHSATGIANALSLYNMSIGSSNAPINYYGVENEISLSQNVLLKEANSIKYPGLFKQVDVDYQTTKDFGSNQQVFNFKAGITKMRVYIWIEGQDVDCENGSSSGNLEFAFQLTTNPS